jgi:CO/xanthine dehydrogenase FAD-binding subunit
MQKNSTVFVSKSLSDVFYHIKSVEGIKILSGCTEIREIGEKSVSLRGIPELRQIEKKERYMEFGSAVTISELISSGGQKLPRILLEAASSIATEPVRNMGTLGGNICAKGIFHTLMAPLLSLNARLELKSPDETIFIPLNKFKSVPEKFILTKVRIPLDEWEIQIFKRVGPSGMLNEFSAAFAFLVDTQRGMVANIRITYAGKVFFYSPDLENKIIGTRLPLSGKKIDEIIDEAKEIFVRQNENVEYGKILRAQFLNLMRNSLEQLM